MLVPACLSLGMVEYVPAGPEPPHCLGVFGRNVCVLGPPCSHRGATAPHSPRGWSLPIVQGRCCLVGVLQPPAHG